MNYSNFKLHSLRSLVCLLSLFVTLSAYAQSAPPSHQDLSPTEQQKLLQLIDAGQDAFDAGEFDTALASFQEAYALFEHPDLQYRIARCYEYLGDFLEAIDAYQRFLDATPDADERGRIEKTISVLTQRHRQSLPATLQINIVPPSAHVFIDSERVPNPSSNAGRIEVNLEPGAHDVWVEQRGFLESRHVIKLSAGESRTLDVALQLSPTDEDESASGWRGTGPVIVGSVGVAAGLIGIYSYTQYASNSDQIDKWDARKDGEKRPPNYDSTHDDMTTYAALTWTAGIISVASLATAAVWWWGFSDNETHTEDTGVALDSVALTPGAADTHSAASDTWGVFVSGRF